MEGFARLLDVVLWPSLILGFGWHFRDDLKDFYLFVRRLIASGGVLRWSSFELKGVEISPDNRDGKVFERKDADEEIFSRREKSYSENKNLFLVHRVQPTGMLHAVTKLPTYDISVYFIPHKNFGRLNDVRLIEYYFGHYFGLSRSKFGTKYIVDNGSEGFAVKINAYGPTLCEARIIFHDGKEATVSRYLDFEGTGYRYEAATTVVDEEKLRNRSEEAHV
jgi:hypothetical protein